MPGQTSQRLHDIEPLAPLLEAGYQLLTPNYRLARRIKLEWDRRQVALGRTVWQPAPVYALENWLQASWLRARGTGSVPARSLLDNTRAREIWLDIIEQDQRTEGGYSLLQPGTAADLAAQARDNLLRWQLDAAEPAIRAEFQLDDDCATFLRWLGAFERRLARGNFATLADGISDLARAPALVAGLRVALLDFDEVPPLYRRCLATHAAELEEMQSGGEPAEIEVIAFGDISAERQAVAAWAARLHREEPTATVGIVPVDMQAEQAPLEYQLRREFGCLGDDYNSLPVNFSTSISLDRAPVVRDALRMLESMGRQISLRDVLGLLQSRFTAATDGDSDLAVKFLQQLFDEGRERVDTGYLRSRAAQVRLGERQGLSLGDSLYRVFELRYSGRACLPSEWVGRWSEVLDCFGWPGPGPLDSLEYQQVEAWYQTLDQFSGYDQVHGPLPLQSALQALLRCCKAQVSHPQTADCNIHVLGPLEAAGLHFDHLWLCGVQGGRWPAAPRPNPFIPLSIQLRSGMPHASTEREWQFASALTMRYRRSSQSMIASYCSQVDGVPELPSPLLMGLTARESGERARLSDEWLQLRSGGDLESIDDSRAPAVIAEELATLRGGSAILEDQSNCPFRAFARRRLHLEPLGENRTALSAGERGEILHNALYILWGRIQDSDVLQQLDHETAAREAATGAIAEVQPKLRQLVGQRCLELEQQRLQSLLLEWLALETQRPPFRVQEREAVLEGEIRSIPLRLRVDRVDEVDGGGRLIVDYKSGRTSLADWLGERPAKPQLPVYGILSDGIDGLAYAQVRPRECRFLGLGTVEGIKGVRKDIDAAVKRYCSAQDWQALQEQWRANLDRLAAGFLEGDAAVDPLPRACDYCGLESLCRVALPAEEEA